MLYVLHGPDDFSIGMALGTLREAIGPEEVRDANTLKLEAGRGYLSQLQSAVAAAPFLGERRLIIVYGLAAKFETQGRGARGPKKGNLPSKEKPGELEALEGTIQCLPETTDVVLIDGVLSRSNLLLRKMESIGRVREFPLLRGEKLKVWVRNRIAAKGVSISSSGLAALCDLIGGNLWVLESELEKLALYAGDRLIEEDDIYSLVSTAKEANIFVALDALMEGRGGIASKLIIRLFGDGASAYYVIALLNRQLRQLVLARELLSSGRSSRKIAQELRINSEFVLGKILEQARRHRIDDLRRLYQKLVDLDMALKSGKFREDLGLDLLVAEVASRN